MSRPHLVRSTASLLRLIVMLTIAGLVLWLLSGMALLIFTAILLAVLLDGASQSLARVTNLPRRLCLALVFLVFIGGLALFGWLVGPRFVTEGQQLISQLSADFHALQKQYAHTILGRILAHSYSSSGPFLVLGPFAPRLLSFTFGTAGNILLLIVTALYLAVSPQLYIKGFIRLMPAPYRPRGREIMRTLGETLRHWMLGQLIDMSVVGILATAGLMLLHIPMPVALGVLAGALTFIPYLGAILAGIPGIIVAATVGPTAILWVILLYTACHLIEGYVVSPIVMRKAVNLPPALTVLSMVFLGELYGFFGVLIATPLTATIIVMVQEIYIQDILGDSAHEGRFRPHGLPQ